MIEASGSYESDRKDLFLRLITYLHQKVLGGTA